MVPAILHRHILHTQVQVLLGAWGSPSSSHSARVFFIRVTHQLQAVRRSAT